MYRRFNFGKCKEKLKKFDIYSRGNRTKLLLLFERETVNLTAVIENYSLKYIDKSIEKLFYLSFRK